MIRPFKAQDMIDIVETGIKEFGVKIVGSEHIKELAEAREANGRCKTAVVDDKVIGIGGLDEIFVGVYEAWLMLSYEVDNRPIESYEVIRDGFAKLFKDKSVRRIEAWCRTDYPKAHTLLKHLGFKVEGKARKRMPDKTDAILYAKVK